MVSLAFRVQLAVRVSLVPMVVTASKAKRVRTVRTARTVKTVRSVQWALLVRTARRDPRVIVASLSCKFTLTLSKAMWI